MASGGESEDAVDEPSEMSLEESVDGVDDEMETEMETGSDNNSDDVDVDTDTDTDISTTDTDDSGTGTSFQKKMIFASFVGVVSGSLLPWVSINGEEELMFYGFETIYGLVTIGLGLLSITVAHFLGWDKRAFAALFVAGTCIAALGMIFIPLGGVGAIITALSGGTIAFMAIGGYSKLS